MTTATATSSMNPFAVPSQFVPGVDPTHASAGSAWWFICVGPKILVQQTNDRLQLPHLKQIEDLGINLIRRQFLGHLSETPCYSAELAPETDLPRDMVLCNLKELHGSLDDSLFALAGRAIQIVDWDRTHQYCGHCATPMVQISHERAKRCPSCDLRQYPRLSPAIIVLISRGEELLLARAPRFKNKMYSVLAGFVEPGESLEETVAREVKEEVGIDVKDIRYFGSQPWPFPNSLMLGFTATYAGGEIVMEPEEIEDAQWFTKDNLPLVPGKLSIARQLIDSFVDGTLG